MEPLGVYIQIPFCASKCSFCNFSSRVERPEAYGEYVHALDQEIERLPGLYARRGIMTGLLEAPVDSIYFGGGTPALVGQERFERIVAGLTRRFRVAGSAEFTLETTPGSADETFLRHAFRLGVNRLSIGAQTFDERELRAVGRLHTPADTRDLVKSARLAGFANISLDLIAGLPHQTADSWEASLGAAIELQPEHLSIYLFEIDEKSRLGREVLERGERYHASHVPSDDFMADAYAIARERLREAGYVQYEISNFARPGLESRHNQKYWRIEPYVGLGAGAHSFDRLHRWANQTSTSQYEEKLRLGESPLAEWQTLSAEEQLEEFFFLGLRQLEGVNLGEARNRWGEGAVNQRETILDELARDGWVEERSGNIRLTSRALLVSNEIFQQFVTV